MNSISVIKQLELRGSVGYRKAVPPEPKAYAQCRNCNGLVYDSDDRYSAKHGDVLRKINIRCKTNNFRVSLGGVCDSHEFRYSNRGDV